MAASPTPAIPRRRLPSGESTVSLLGFVVETTGPTGPASDRAVIERLRQARTAGVSLFDAAGSRDPDRARALLATAFPVEDPDLWVVVGDEGSVEPLVGTSRPSPFPRATSQLTSATVPFKVLLEVGTSRTEDARERDRQSARVRAAPSTGLVTRLDPTSESLPTSPGSNLYVGPFSLLDHRLGPLLDSAYESGPVGLFARDPFAGGRLDGSRLGDGWLGLGPSAPPPTLRSLAEEFEPVLRLGFLTARRTRTLAQAALQYVASHRWVVSILAPLPPADRLAELLGAFSRPDLTPEEIAEVEGAGSAGRGQSSSSSLK